MDTQVHRPVDRLAHLEELSPAPGRRWNLVAERLSLGRDQMSDICVDDPTVSRHHADLVSRGDDWVIVDLASTTGTLVNGLEIHQQVLRNGDRVRVGNSELQFMCPHGISAGKVRGSEPARLATSRQVGNNTIVSGNQTNIVQRGTLEYISSRRGLARRLIIWGVVLFFGGEGTAMTAVLIFQHFVFSNIDSSNPSPPPLPGAFFPLFAVGAFAVLTGLALFVAGLITRSGAKRSAQQAGVAW